MAPAVGHDPRDERLFLVPAKEAARILGVHPNTLCKWRIAGRAPQFFKVGRRVRYSTSDISTWMSERTYSNTAEYGRDGQAGGRPTVVARRSGGTELP
jgi:excisionase family DNA binding protein